MKTAYDEAIDFLASGITPESLVAFQTSPEARERFESLIAREKSEGLLPEEAEELDRMMEMERLLGLAKARARLKIQQSSSVSHE